MYYEIEIIRRKSLSIFSYRGVFAAEDRSLFFFMAVGYTQSYG